MSALQERNFQENGSPEKGSISFFGEKAGLCLISCLFKTDQKYGFKPIRENTASPQLICDQARVGIISQRVMSVLLYEVTKQTKTTRGPQHTHMITDTPGTASAISANHKRSRITMM